jgi:hypothetical protein
MTRADLARWIAGYERAWRTAGAESLRELFSSDATYQVAPFQEPIGGLDQIAAFWEAEREGPDETFVLTSEIVAVEGRVGVARIEVGYGDPVSLTYRDLWIVTLDAEGRGCVAFEEWPFFPGRQRVSA